MTNLRGPGRGLRYPADSCLPAGVDVGAGGQECGQSEPNLRLASGRVTDHGVRYSVAAVVVEAGLRRRRALRRYGACCRLLMLLLVVSVQRMTSGGNNVYIVSGRVVSRASSGNGNGEGN